MTSDEPPFRIVPVKGRRAMQRLAVVHGVRCAAWLARDRRESIRLTGAIRVEVPRKPPASYAPEATWPPAWFQVAIIEFRRRTSMWRVVELSTAKSIVYQIIWLRWRGPR